jgi:hypothetical protein
MIKTSLFALLLACLSFHLSAQTQSKDTSTQAGVLIVPYQSMMYFSDADPDLARFSKMDEMKVRTNLRLDLESNVYHQLLASFNAISLLRANTMNGEADLNKIYGATRYTVYSKQAQDEYHATGKSSAATTALKNLSTKFKLSSKNQTYWTSDSSVMLGVIADKELIQYLHKKYNEKYILFITQFEINTNNKNSIEWLKQDYVREYTIHYNLFDYTGTLIRAEMITIKAGNENKLDDIKSKYLIALAQRLKEIVQTAN